MREKYRKFKRYYKLAKIMYDGTSVVANFNIKGVTVAANDILIQSCNIDELNSAYIEIRAAKRTDKTGIKIV